MFGGRLDSLLLAEIVFLRSGDISLSISSLLLVGCLMEGYGDCWWMLGAQADWGTVG